MTPTLSSAAQSASPRAGALATSASQTLPRPSWRALQSRQVGQSGSVTLEVAVLAPALLVLLGLVIAAGRLTVAGTALDDSASAAARAASLTRSATTATMAARTAATDALASQHLHCRHLDVTVDTSGFRAPVGTPAQIAVTVACTLDLSAAAVPGLPGQRTLTANAISVLDTYRTRSLGFTP